jgi:ABC-type Na+ transport system ATPase subunit NatA
VEELCSGIIIMQEGRVIWAGTIQDMKAHMDDANLESAFMEITRTYRSSVEDAFSEQDKPSILNLFGRRKK